MRESKGEIQARIAIDRMKSFTSKVNMNYEENDTIAIDAFSDNFYSMPVKSATPGVLIMGLDSDNDEKFNIIKIPPKGAVYHHFHDDLIETVKVIKGSVSYKIYLSDIRSKIIGEGILKENEIMVIMPKQTHFVFSCTITAYLLIGFKKIKE